MMLFGIASERAYLLIFSIQFYSIIKASFYDFQSVNLNYIVFPLQALPRQAAVRLAATRRAVRCS